MKQKVMNQLPIICKIILAASALTAVLTVFLFNGDAINLVQATTLIVLCAIGTVGGIVTLIQAEE